MADVAQMAEHQVVALVAVGSNPIIRPKKKALHQYDAGLFSSQRQTPEAD